ncbi:MAG: 6-pyruvoyl-tetrahydropterin synthase-related protein, partial [Chloroflexi bacterium]|nr:6-pyruvoyl-tetrahydropterin synthase-related protein [Chloroflexota bacterium]
MRGESSNLGMRGRSATIYFVLISLLAGFSTMPLFQPYFFASSDGLFHLYRLMEYDTVLRDGVLYPRWAPDFFFGYGYPLFNFYAPLTYYLGEIFRLLGAGYIDSLKCLVVLAMVLSGIGAYLYARGFLSPPASLLVAVAYMYVPYHIVNLYYRGDIAEYLAYTWFPFVLWSLRKAIQSGRIVHVVAGSLWFAALILTHNLSAFIFSGFLVIYWLGLLAQKWFFAGSTSEEEGDREPSSLPTGSASGRGAPSPGLRPTSPRGRGDTLPAPPPGRTGTSAPTSGPRERGLVPPLPLGEGWGEGAPAAPAVPDEGPRSARARNQGYRVVTAVVRLLATALLGVGLTAFFWLPAMAEKSLVDFDRLLFHYNFIENFPTVDQLLSTSLVHRYGVVFRSADVFGYKLGALEGLFLVLGAIVLAWRWRAIGVSLRVEAATSLLVAALSFFFIFPTSLWIWENVPLLNLTQFPWRFLAFVALPSALLAGLLVEALSPRMRWIATPVIVSLVIFSSTAGMSPILSNLKEADVSPLGSIQFELTYGAIGTSAAAEYLPRWVKERPATAPAALAALLNEKDIPSLASRTAGVEAQILEKKANRATYRVSSGAGGTIVLNTLYYPGWQAFLDGKKIDIGVDDPSGLIKLSVPGGEHVLRLEFVETRLRLVGDGISALALVAVLLLLGGSLKGWRPSTWRPPGLAWDRHSRIAVAIVVGLIAVWLMSKVAYDSAYTPPKSHKFPLVINLNNQVMIEGYDLSGVDESHGLGVRAVPDSPVQITLFWHALGQNPDAAGYRPFARL